MWLRRIRLDVVGVLRVWWWGGGLGVVVLGGLLKGLFRS